MTRRLPLTRVFAVCAAAFAVALGAFQALNGSARPGGARGANAAALVTRGDKALQRARETADPGYHARAEAAFESALRRDAGSVDATIGLATLALASHDFHTGLRHAQRARRLGPQLARPYAVLVDAELELGRYEQAGRSLQRMIDLRPSLASYARVSYFRELHGDLAGAARAMRLAVSAGGGAPENPFRGRRQGALVDEGDYLVTVTVNGQTTRHVVPVERVSPVVEVEFEEER